jgi:hypothetical protein
MDDEQIHDRIDQLVAEEPPRLHRASATAPIAPQRPCDVRSRSCGLSIRSIRSARR